MNLFHEYNWTHRRLTLASLNQGHLAGVSGMNRVKTLSNIKAAFISYSEKAVTDDAAARPVLINCRTAFSNYYLQLNRFCYCYVEKTCVPFEEKTGVGKNGWKCSFVFLNLVQNESLNPYISFVFLSLPVGILVALATALRRWARAT